MNIQCTLCKSIFGLFKIFLMSCLILLLCIVYTLKLPNNKNMFEIFSEIFIEISMIFKKKMTESVFKIF